MGLQKFRPSFMIYPLKKIEKEEEKVEGLKYKSRNE